MSRTCSHCGGPKGNVRRIALYCSAACKQAAHRKRSRPPTVTPSVTDRSRWKDLLPRSDYRSIFSAACADDLRARLLMLVTTADDALLDFIFDAVKDRLRAHPR